MPGRVTRLAGRIPPQLGVALERSHQTYLGRRSRRLSRRGAEATSVDEHGVPVPPRRLIRLVSGSQEPAQWLRTGRAEADMIRDIASRNGAPCADMGAILDLGCGCGRVLRWWAGHDGPRVEGCDYDGRLTEWCQRHLPSVEVKTNGSRPPLPYKAGSFDFVYAISLFTHLTEAAQQQWMQDVARVLVPGGLLLFTAHGERFARHLGDAEREAFARGQAVVTAPELNGMEGCAAFHPPSYVRDRLIAPAGFELVDAIYEDRSDQPEDAKPTLALQDAYLVRKLA